MRRATGMRRIRITVRNPAPPAGVVGRSWALVRWPFVSLGRELRSGWLMTRGAAPAKRWRSPLRRTLGISFAVLLALCLVLWIVKAAVAVFSKGQLIWPDWPWSVDPDTSCRATGYSCGVVNSTVIPVLTLALTTVFFLVWRFRSVHSFYMRKAKHESRSIVESAGSIMGYVVGRDQLCNALMDNMRDSTARRPHVVVGAIGTGKTALVVRLTEMLARQGAFPVPVRLRDAQSALNFSALAYARFRSIVEPQTRSDAEAEKVWRLLRRHGKIVVLADGLEEALSGNGLAAADRDNLIRKAIRAAGDARLPLVITSRPHDPLRAMEAAVTELEPLSEETALEYISSNGDWRADKRRLGRIIEVANVTESPLYLQVAKDLHHRNLLEQVWVSEEDGLGDAADHTMWELRFDLLEAWTDALLDGYLHSELPLTRDERRVSVEYISALACIGLKSDSSQVKFDQLEAGPSSSLIAAELRRRRGESPIDVRLAATWGTRMGIVEESGDFVRFQHSIMQAYLGSRYLDTVLGAPGPDGRPAPDGNYFPAALRDPGREILISLVFHSRSLKENACCTCPATGGPDPACPIRALRSLLLEEACRALPQSGPGRPEAACPQAAEVRTSPAKVLDMYGAALDIDSVDNRPDPGAIAAPLPRVWSKLQERDPGRLRSAKISLVRRLGAASRSAALSGGRPAYDQLYAIARQEPVYHVRTAIAQEIGAGGEAAFTALRDRLLGPAPTVTRWEASVAGPPPRTAPRRAPGPGGERERRKQDRAGRARQDEAEREQEAEEARQERSSWNQNTMSARLVPMLVDSVAMAHHADTPYDDLESWLSTLASDSGGEEHRDPYGKRGLEVALAHGFKHAANRRVRPPARGDAREFLAEQAWGMLKDNRFWFTRLTLLHALTLWALPDDVTQQRPEHGHGADPKEQVRRWLRLPPGEREHPLVAAAGRLAVRALETRCPERFLWIDEARVASQVGSESGSPAEPCRHNLWIPPSAGWSTLDPDAQQLLADVVLLVSLTERADRPRELFRRLDWDRGIAPQLPTCLSHDRTTMDPARTTAHTAAALPGSRCADVCPFNLCPAPPKIPDLRVELSEVFCMNQRSLLRRWQPWSWLQLRFRRRARWQRRTSVAALRQFWEQMGERARDVPQPEEQPARQRPRG
ncbi:NACHT domain-containing protein [Kitasatospora sp. NPDC057223]|uniref:NACHT domain-containing protein n=1 Tax=Kitasatospora sp. NPDC057223 TaxID=3346055 RepID=UPI00362A7A3A